MHNRLLTNRETIKMNNQKFEVLGFTAKNLIEATNSVLKSTKKRVRAQGILKTSSSSVTFEASRNGVLTIKYKQHGKSKIEITKILHKKENQYTPESLSIGLSANTVFTASVYNTSEYLTNTIGKMGSELLQALEVSKLLRAEDSMNLG